MRHHRPCPTPLVGLHRRGLTARPGSRYSHVTRCHANLGFPKPCQLSAGHLQPPPRMCPAYGGSATHYEIPVCEQCMCNALVLGCRSGLVWRCWPALVGWRVSPACVPSVQSCSCSCLCIPAQLLRPFVEQKSNSLLRSCFSCGACSYNADQHKYCTVE